MVQLYWLRSWCVCDRDAVVAWVIALRVRVMVSPPFLLSMSLSLAVLLCSVAHHGAATCTGSTTDQQALASSAQERQRWDSTATTGTAHTQQRPCTTPVSTFSCVCFVVVLIRRTSSGVLAVSLACSIASLVLVGVWHIQLVAQKHQHHSSSVCWSQHGKRHARDAEATSHAAQI